MVRWRTTKLKELPPAEKIRGDKEEAKWEALVAKEKVEKVSMVEVPFFMPLGSKSAAEVLMATKETLLQGLWSGVRQQGLSSPLCRSRLCAYDQVQRQGGGFGGKSQECGQDHVERVKDGLYFMALCDEALRGPRAVGCYHPAGRFVIQDFLRSGPRCS